MSNCLYRAAELEREEWEQQEKREREIADRRNQVVCMGEEETMKYIIELNGKDKI